MSTSEPDPPLRDIQIAIVGPCASGKSTLASGLEEHGLSARQIAQEHSYVPDMWQVITNPDILIYLDASYETCSIRKNLNWLPHEYAEQERRLEHAREHCHIYLNTDDKSPKTVLESVLDALWDVLGQ